MLRLFVALSIFMSLPLVSAYAQYRVTATGELIEADLTQSAAVEGIIDAMVAGEISDIVDFKLAIDQTIDPMVDAEAVKSQLDEAVAIIRMMAGSGAGEARLLDALRAFVYSPGDWNQNKPFSYDHSDPLGTDVRNKLLSTYLETRLGNCVSMPILVLTLGRKLGMDMTLANAPTHMFVKYRPKGQPIWINLETTSGANPTRDEWLRQGFPMSDLSIKKGLYMRPLSPKEVVANLAVVALEHAYGEKRYWDAIIIAEKIMLLDPKNLTAVLLHGSSHAALMDEDFHQQFPQSEDVPAHLIPVYQRFAAQNRAALAYAQDLGYVPEN